MRESQFSNFSWNPEGLSLLIIHCFNIWIILYCFNNHAMSHNYISKWRVYLHSWGQRPLSKAPAEELMEMLTWLKEKI